jgi:lipopolysaccharide/colanic/teichoic acid biosynthesis glycosyltransferase
LNRLIGILLLLLICPLIFLLVLIGVFFYKNPIYIQKRIGFKLQPFKLMKLRSIPQGQTQPDQWGTLLRKYSLDELLQLWNIVKGDMNFIGPRPLLPEYLSLYNPQQILRHDVKPGLTGWAQVQGRNNLSWQEQFELDVWFVNNRTFWLDLKILYLTFFKVFKPSKGETQQREAFNGSN